MHRSYTVASLALASSLQAQGRGAPAAALAAITEADLIALVER